MWNPRKTVPAKHGLYVVAEFDGDRLVEYNLDFAFVGYWTPNRVGSTSGINFTHWMSYEDFRKLLETASRIVII